MRIIAFSSSKRNSASARAELGFADAGRAEKNERTDRAVLILQAGARAAHGIRHRDDRLLLADDALHAAALPCAPASRARLPASARPECASSSRPLPQCLPRSLPRCSNCGLPAARVCFRGQLGQFAFAAPGFWPYWISLALAKFAAALRLFQLGSRSCSSCSFSFRCSSMHALFVLPLRLQAARIFSFRSGQLLFDLRQALLARGDPSPSSAPGAPSRAA